MKDTEQILHNVGETVEYAKQYIQHQKEYLRLEAAEKTSKILSKVVTAVILLFLALFILILGSITIALFLGQLLGSAGLGFLCVTGCYILMACFLYVFKNALIINPTITAVVKAFLK